MKKVLLLIVLLPLLSTAIAQESNREQIEKVLVEAYVNGVFKKFDEAAIRKGFHPDFQFHLPMMTPNGRKDKKVVLDDWIKMVSSMEFQNIDYKIIDVYESGKAACSVSEIYQNGKKLYTDYIVWSKIEEDWVIMGKTFSMHQGRRKR